MVVGGLLLQLGKDKQPGLFGTDEWEEIFLPVPEVAGTKLEQKCD
jgi:hypothetical protein